jgi:hypothetical protein
MRRMARILRLQEGLGGSIVLVLFLTFALDARAIGLDDDRPTSIAVPGGIAAGARVVLCEGRVVLSSAS